MPFLNTRVLDGGLAAFATEGTRLDICSAEPATYADATGAMSVGNKTISIGAPAARSPSGRKVTVPAITDGDVTATATATHFAITDPANSRLLLADALPASQAMTDGNVFTIGAFDIGIPGLA